MIHEISQAKEVLYIFKDSNGNKKVVAVKGVYISNKAKDGSRNLTPINGNNNR